MNHGDDDDDDDDGCDDDDDGCGGGGGDYDVMVMSWCLLHMTEDIRNINGV